jgi:uncharacterized membrane protein YhaH (DUF805 family)
MGIGHYLFGFSGRINRAKMWLFFLISFVFVCVVVFGVVASIGLQHLMAIGQHRENPVAVFSAMGPVFGVVGLGYLLLLWVGLAVTAKRLHDRDRSAWWILVFIILPLVLNVARFGMEMSAMHMHGAMATPANPLVSAVLGLISLGINVWAFLELYCFRGTQGENRFGPDPLA